MVKGVGSERSYEMLTLSLQTLGGSGFLQDYPIEQYIRDAKIDSLYEGTTGIQSLDLFFRKIIRDNGKAFGALLAKIRDFAAADGGNGRLKAERAALAEAAAHVEAMAGRHGGLPDGVGGPARRDLQGGAEHDQAADGARRPGHRMAAADPRGDRPAQAGRARRRTPPIATSTRASWPRAGSSPPPCCPGWPPSATIVEETTLDLMDLPEGAF